VFLETERLVLRRLVPADAELLFELDSDPEVQRYVHAGPPDLGRIREEVLPRMSAYYGQHRDLGFWAAEEKPTRAFVGWFHLRPEAGPLGAADPELGYRLRRQTWGRGLATDGATGLVAVAFAESETSRIVAATLVGNRASQRVLDKVGFERTEEFFYEQPPYAETSRDQESRRSVRYVLSRERWRGARRSPSRS
jgi:RimJ/RimL family protein N-acetyltransferase